MIAALRAPVPAGERYCLLPRPVFPAQGQCHLLSDIALDEPITAAEQDVLAYLCAGYSNKEIAVLLGKAEPTVKHQVASILHKRRVPSRARLIAALR